MATANERVCALVTPREKARISLAARAAGESVGEWMRRAARSFVRCEEESALDGLLAEVRSSTAAASSAIDSALAVVATSRTRIDAMERVAREQKLTEGQRDRTRS